MAANAVSAKVLSAAGVTLARPFSVHGMNTYTISSDFISWNDSHNHTISDIAEDFGKRTSGSGEKIFTCGDDKISVYDFGLLYTVFTAMTAAQAELDEGFITTETVASREDVRVLWIGNDLILYSPGNNLILPIDNGELERICSGERLECSNFCTKDRYSIDRERVELFITDLQHKELFCRLRISAETQKCYSKYFEQPTTETKKSLATWDLDSMLGRLVNAVDTKLPARDAFLKYKKKGLIESLGKRGDLFVSPSQTYSDLKTPEDLKKFFGSVCYTDKDEAVIAVNYRAGMFIYSPCFPGDTFEGLQVDTSPNLDKFYDVSVGCERIMRYANTVICRPLTPAQLDVRVYNMIASALMHTELPRIPFSSCLGKVVIPESVLESAFEDGFGADLFCLVPVGVVGEIVVCITSAGKLESVYPRGWSTKEAFYDITEVVMNVER